ncbi:BlaI/MecI/CopY family transcriptional regulator [Lacticaseibacillus pabuli]|uniref:BlaI/MecI/CopY family transcriptional regulator n=1 Tax=Lacticaseibacillus pabuli TaxID=3025672 RepID=A0ABY7WU80_9LACO|nr:BlaI/MecI/CopY family transcriptional regulator [Lacticaseibacillus sp. KACC 23028]WDF82599.1 BlaI/MecI/CopY family transcriptional regulator [Lacticaseibacillus sp. KACC 23028]
MPEKIKLTRREEDMLKTLWASDEPMSARAVANSAGISMNTVQAVLRKLLRAGCIETAKIGYSGTVLTREYIATVSEEDYYATVLSPQAVKGLVEHFITNDATEDDLTEIEQAVKEARQ